MSVRFQILPEANLVYVSCADHVDVAQTLASFGAYVQHPAFRPGQNQLIDLTEVTSYERDFTRIMSMQAEQAEAYIVPDKRPYLMFIAPNEMTQKMAMSSLRSWQQLDSVVPMVVHSLVEALDVLGLDQNHTKYLTPSIA